ncbi:MAG: sel1 repeat family protein, partial [Chlorobiaceae bacterium]|nr:sel1 repeat family protein [Chlorobiaceae bacterium]
MKRYIVFFFIAITALTAYRAFCGEPSPDAAAEQIEELQSAARNGNPLAQYNLGVAYSTGKGVRADYFESVKWFRMAAEKGHAEAQYNLGLALEKGRGVFMDYPEAVRWYRRAAQQNYSPAMNRIGEMYTNAHGVPRNYREAFNWFWLAAEKGFAAGQHNLGTAYDKGLGTARNYSLAFKWYLLAAQQGYAPAQNSLGIMYQYGRGVQRNIDEAVKWYRLAAEQGLGDVNLSSGKNRENLPGATPGETESSLVISPEKQRDEAVATYSHEKQHQKYVFDRKRLAVASRSYPPKQQVTEVPAKQVRGEDTGQTTGSLPAGSLQEVARQDAVTAIHIHDKLHEKRPFRRMQFAGASGSYAPVRVESAATARQKPEKAEEKSRQSAAAGKPSLALPHEKSGGIYAKSNDALISDRKAAEKGNAKSQYNLGVAY